MRENIEALFADGLRYHVDGKTLSKEDIESAVTAVRESPKRGRRVEPSDFVESGDMLRWYLSATLPGMGPNRETLRQESDLRAVFNAEGKIQEVWSEASQPR